MARQSISLTSPNDEWLKSQVESKEYSSKSEVVNDLIRHARKKEVELNFIKSKLKASEKSGFTKLNADEILNQSKSQLNDRGEL